MRFARCVAAIACALAAAGCSGSGSDESQEPGDTSLTPTIESDPTESVSPTDPATTADSAAPSDADAATVAFEQWVDAYVRSDGPTACALQTDEYTSTDLQQSIDSGVISPGTAAKTEWSREHACAGIRLRLRRSLDQADVARRDKVTLAVKFHGAPQEVFVMTLEDGTWLVAREIDKSD